VSKKLPRAIKEKKAPIQSMVRNIFLCQQSQYEVIEGPTQLIPITRPRRLYISTYGGRSPAVRRILAMTPMIIMGNEIPRSYNGFVVSGVFPKYMWRRAVTLRVNIKAASAPPITSHMTIPTDVAFHTGQWLTIVS
jgi:hypothetical protein